jgi:hypothetical protein
MRAQTAPNVGHVTLAAAIPQKVRPRRATGFSQSYGDVIIRVARG